jgi:hypothetical protein
MKEVKLKTIKVSYLVDLEFDVRHIPSDVLSAMCESEDDSDTWGSNVDKNNELAMKATDLLDKNLKFGKKREWWYSLNDYKYEME